MHTCTFTGKIEHLICSWNTGSESVFLCHSHLHVKVTPVTCQLNTLPYKFLTHLEKINSEPKKKNVSKEKLIFSLKNLLEPRGPVPRTLFSLYPKEYD